ncbi:hypothetical protein U1Q18_012183, partial [Sarracenia purpurea var. burkii]
SYLPPSRCTYGKSEPLSLAQAQVLGSMQVPLQLNPGALLGSFTFFAIRMLLRCVKPDIFNSSRPKEING